jgi:hypothetical protein
MPMILFITSAPASPARQAAQVLTVFVHSGTTLLVMVVTFVLIGQSTSIFDVILSSVGTLFILGIDEVMVDVVPTVFFRGEARWSDHVSALWRGKEEKQARESALAKSGVLRVVRPVEYFFVFIIYISSFLLAGMYLYFIYCIASK